MSVLVTLFSFPASSGVSRNTYTYILSLRRSAHSRPPTSVHSPPRPHTRTSPASKCCALCRGDKPSLDWNKLPHLRLYLRLAHRLTVFRFPPSSPPPFAVLHCPCYCTPLVLLLPLPPALRNSPARVSSHKFRSSSNVRTASPGRGSGVLAKAWESSRYPPGVEGRGPPRLIIRINSGFCCTPGHAARLDAGEGRGWMGHSIW